jgi:hypothetical protein
MTASALVPFTQNLMLAIAMLVMVFLGVWTRRIELRPRDRTKHRRPRGPRRPHGGAET